MWNFPSLKGKTFVIAVHFTDLLSFMLKLMNFLVLIMMRPLPRPFSHPTSRMRPQGSQTDTNGDSVHDKPTKWPTLGDWDDSYSNWRAPRRMPHSARPINAHCAFRPSDGRSNGRRTIILQSVSSHVEARTFMRFLLKCGKWNIEEEQHDSISAFLHLTSICHRTR